MLQLGLGLVEQQDTEHLVVNQPCQQLSDAPQKLIEVENRSQLLADFIEHGERLRLA